MAVALSLDFQFVAQLPDGTLLFASSDTPDGFFMIRLDQDLARHNFLNGGILVLDAKPINDGLQPGCSDFDLYHLVKRLIAERFDANGNALRVR